MNWALDEQVRRKSSSTKWLVVIGAFVFLLFGLLWQNDLLPFDSSLFKGPPAKEKTKNALSRTKPSHTIRVPIRGSRPRKRSPISRRKSHSSNSKEGGQAFCGKTTSKPVEGRSSVARSTMEPRVPPANNPTALPLSPLPQDSMTQFKGVPAPNANYPYSLRVGSFRTLARAKKATSALKGKGLHPYWSRVNLGRKGKWFRVFVGCFMTTEEAKAFRIKHALTGSVVSKTTYAVQIGTYPSFEHLSHEMATLDESSHSPYAIENPQEGYRLVMGAFPSKKTAEQLAVELKKSGIHCMAVRR